MSINHSQRKVSELPATKIVRAESRVWMSASKKAPDFHDGFTRAEWLIVVVALVILVAVSYPAYKNYTIRPKFAQLPVILAPYKAAIENCAKDGSCVVAGALAGLDTGVMGVPPSIATTYLARVTVSPKGVITAYASKAGGLAGETIVLTPTLSKDMTITWAVSGTCKTRESGSIC